MPTEIAIKPFRFKCASSVLPPGSKSLTNRAMILAALAGGRTRIEGALFSRDTEIMADCLARLGYVVNLNRFEKTVEIESPGSRPPNSCARLHVGNAGTAARFVTALAALRRGGKYRFDCDEPMRSRPMAGLIEALESQGASFEFLGEKNALPFILKAEGLKGGGVSVDAGASIQMLSALLMVSAFADSPMRVSLRGDTVSKPFVEMTLGIMSQFGVKADFENGAYSAAFSPSAGAERVYCVEPDATAASYFIALPAVAGGACEIKNFADCRLQGDAAFCGILSKAGLIDCFAVGGSLVAEASGRRDFPESLELDFNDISDTFLTLAAISPLLPFKLSIRGIGHTRAQETDRVAACAAQLRKFCAKVDETEDSISITPHPPERLAEIAQTTTLVNTYADHRIAMSFSILASRDVRGDGRPWIAIEDPGCVSKTWAEFFEVLYTARSDSGALRVVAVDGGAAVGKSSVSKECARILGYMHVDTGAHYRTVAYALLGEGISPGDPALVAERLKSVKLGTVLCGNSARATLDGKLVDDALIRTERVNSEVAKFAAIAEVREFLKSYQRSMADFARSHGFAGLIMEGRDIGSVIFPDADVRIFLDADEQTRAARRAREGIADSIGLRDAMDRSRKTAPLRCPESAERIDTSNMTKEEVVRLTLSLILES